MLIEPFHQDTIQDIAFNQNGSRFAIASSDQTLRIFNKVDGKWEKSSEFKFSCSNAWKVKWADPKFGQLIAISSQSKGIQVWEEKKQYLENSNGQKQITTVWKQRSLTLEKTELIVDIQFGSKSNGLLLVIAFADGIVQVHRAYENNQFRLEAEEISIMPYGLRALSWNQAPSDKDMSIFAGNDENSRYLRLKLENYTLQRIKTLSIWILQHETQKLTFTKFFEFDEEKTVYDVQWANQNGKSYHQIAFATQEGVKIWQFRFIGESQVEKQNLIYINQDPLQNSLAYKVQWNSLANLLSISYEFIINDNQQQTTTRDVKVFQLQNGNWITKTIISEPNLIKDIQSLLSIPSVQLIQ
ncbi:unnamed protein product [Paramecium pentaurelia]|uniref:Uncharacterized protein n=1 Tax=Paramecium pentaurelia TaxID=43138 RepID=A0A8S1U6Q1_9CILI|nr:unnamed protein product [Paramecium pentaurelia]